MKPCDPLLRFHLLPQTPKGAMENQCEEFRDLLQNMTSSLETARTSLQAIKERQQNLDMTNGISLLSLKHQVFISYLRSLVLVSGRRLLGHSLGERSPPSLPFSSQDRERRASHAGDLVDSMIEGRLVLEKIDTLESKMRYQIEKLVRIADAPARSTDAIEDPLAFKPNPQALINNNDADSREGVSGSKNLGEGDGVYRPPRLAPMPYVEKSTKQSRRDRPPVPSALATLSADPYRPYEETTSGMGGAPSLASARAKHLQRIQDYEEENFTRLVMKKSDAKRRARDEEDLALGGDLGGGSGRRSRAGGLEDEFGDILRSVGRASGVRSQGDGYDELRKRGKKMAVLDRSRRKRDSDDGDETPRLKKRSRFEMEMKSVKRKQRR